jgi:hypothetical protein
MTGQPQRDQGNGQTQRHDADCLPAAVATVLDLPVELLPEVDHDATDWIGDYNDALARARCPFALITSNPEPFLPGRWIAVVPSLTQPPPIKHAVVMQGSRLLWDVGRKAKYQTIERGQIKCAIYVVATGPGWGPGRNFAWEPQELCYGGEG